METTVTMTLSKYEQLKSEKEMYKKKYTELKQEVSDKLYNTFELLEIKKGVFIAYTHSGLLEELAQYYFNLNPNIITREPNKVDKVLINLPPGFLEELEMEVKRYNAISNKNDDLWEAIDKTAREGLKYKEGER